MRVRQWRSDAALGPWLEWRQEWRQGGEHADGLIEQAHEHA